MKRRKLSTGELGWVGISLFVVAVDTIAWIRQDETMSVSFGRWVQNPKGRAATGIAWATVSAHLFWSTPLPGAKVLKSAVIGTTEKIRTRSK